MLKRSSYTQSMPQRTHLSRAKAPQGPRRTSLSALWPTFQEAAEPRRGTVSAINFSSLFKCFDHLVHTLDFGGPSRQIVWVSGSSIQCEVFLIQKRVDVTLFLSRKVLKIIGSCELVCRKHKAGMRFRQSARTKSRDK